MSDILEKLESDVVSEINNGHTVVRLCSNGMMVVICSPRHRYQLNDILENHEAMKKLAGNEKRLVLTVAQHSTITRDARKYLALGLHEYFVKAEVFVIKSMAQRILAILYISLRRPIIPTNYFTSANKAYQWLMSLG